MHKIKDTPEMLQEAFKKVCETWEACESDETKKSPEKMKEHFFLAGYIEVFRMLDNEETP